MKLSYDSKHLRPEVATVFRTSSFPGIGKRLAGEASREEEGPLSFALGVGSKLSDVSIDLGLRPMLAKHGLAKGINLAEDMLDVGPCPFSRESEATNATE